MVSINITNFRTPHLITSAKQKDSNCTKLSSKPTETDSFNKQERLTKNQKLGIGVVIFTTVALMTNAIINKHRRMNAIKQIPKELKTIFEELKSEQGESFINKAYSKLKTYMKLDGIAPEKICNSMTDNGSRIQGGFNPTLNIIEFSNEFFTKLPKFEQFALLAHELKHAEQTSKILRSGLIDEYAYAWAHSSIKRNINNPIDINFNMAYKDAVKNGKEEIFIKNVKEHIKNIMIKNHSETLKMPKFKKGSPEYSDAQRYIDATKKYSGIEDKDEYLNNPIEKEAYAWGGKLGKYFRAFFGDK